MPAGRDALSRASEGPRVVRWLEVQQAIDGLGLQRLDVIYPGADVFPMTDRIRAVGIGALGDTLREIPANPPR